MSPYLYEDIPSSGGAVWLVGFFLIKAKKDTVPSGNRNFLKKRYSKWTEPIR